MSNMEWHTAAKEYLTRVGAAEYQAQRKAWKRSPKTFRFCPSEYMTTLIGHLNRDDENGFKAIKGLEGYASAVGV